MALTPDVVAGTLVQSAWGNEIRDRTVQQFSTVAERNTWIDPPKGAMAVTTDTNALWMRGDTQWHAAVIQGRSGILTATMPSGTAAAVGAINYGVTFAAAPTVIGSVVVGSNRDLVLNWTLNPSTTSTGYRVVTKDGLNVAASTPFGIHWLAMGILAS